MTSRAIFLFVGIVLISLAWVFFQLWTLYDRLGGPLLLVYSSMTVAALVAGAVALLLGVVRRRRAPGGLA